MAAKNDARLVSTLHRPAFDWGNIVLPGAAPIAGVLVALLSAPSCVILKADPITAYRRWSMARRQPFGYYTIAGKGHPIVAGGAGYLRRVPRQCHQHRRRGPDHCRRRRRHLVPFDLQFLARLAADPRYADRQVNSGVGVGVRPWTFEGPPSRQRDPEHYHDGLHRSTIDVSAHSPAAPGSQRHSCGDLSRPVCAASPAGLVAAFDPADVVACSSNAGRHTRRLGLLFLVAHHHGYRIRAVGLNPDAHVMQASTSRSIRRSR